MLKRLKRLWEISGDEQFAAKSELHHAPLPEKGDGKAVLLEDQTEEEAEQFIRDIEGGWSRMKRRLKKLMK